MISGLLVCASDGRRYFIPDPEHFYRADELHNRVDVLKALTEPPGEPQEVYLYAAHVVSARRIERST